jgi:hypothetical protein
MYSVLIAVPDTGALSLRHARVNLALIIALSARAVLRRSTVPTRLPIG